MALLGEVLSIWIDFDTESPPGQSSDGFQTIYQYQFGYLLLPPNHTKGSFWDPWKYPNASKITFWGKGINEISVGYKTILVKVYKSDWLCIIVVIPIEVCKEYI